MITKRQLAKTGRVRVTFELPAPEAASVQLLGDFTEWRASSPMRRAGDGSWRVSLDLAAGREYAFRYLVDGERWVNDPAADRYAPNPFGTENSIVET